MAQETSAAEDAALDSLPENQPDAPDSPADAGDVIAQGRATLAAQEAAAEAKALESIRASMKAMKAQPADAAESGEAAPAEPVAEAKPPIPAPEAKPEPPAAPDPKADEVMRRLAAVEARARAAEAKAKDYEARIARAQEWEDAAAAAEAGDASKVFNRLKWTKDTVEKYLTQGPEALKPTVVEKKADTALDEVKQLREELQRREKQQVVDSYLGQIRQSVPQLATVAPTVLKFYTDPDTGALDNDAVAQAIWAEQVRNYNRRDQDGNPDPLELSPEEAAKALEAGHQKAAKRYGASKPAPANPVASQPGTVPSKQVSPASPKKPLPAPKTQKEIEARDEQDALALLAGLKKQRALAPAVDE